LPRTTPTVGIQRQIFWLLARPSRSCSIN
jgi:hypothetical protein